MQLIQRHLDQNYDDADVYAALSGLMQKVATVKREPEPVFEYLECPVVCEIERPVEQQIPEDEDDEMAVHF